MRCPNCGIEVSDEFAVCPNCLNRLQVEEQRLEESQPTKPLWQQQLTALRHGRVSLPEATADEESVEREEIGLRSTVWRGAWVLVISILILAVAGLIWKASTRPTAERYMNQGHQYYGQGDYEAAVIAFKQAAAEGVQVEDPDLVPATVMVGWSLYQTGDYDQAIAFFEIALEASPDTAEAYAGLGWCYCGKSEYSQASEMFEQALQLDPDLAIAQQGLSACP